MGHSVQVKSRPDTEEMRLLLEHLFDGDLDGCHNGLIELCWTDTNTGALSRAQLFGTDEIEDLIAKAYEVNSVEGQNVYIGAALRKPDTQRGQRCSDMDFFALTAAFADFDDEEAVERFKERGKFALPTIVVTTGKEPHTRFQAWWRLEEPIRDPEAARRQCSGLVAALGSDEKVVNPGRVMRLGGSIAWPKKDGRVKEVTTVQAFSNAPKVYEPGRLERAYPPVDVIPNISTEDTQTQDGVVFGTDGLGLPDKAEDHRELHMTKKVYGAMFECAAYHERYPTEDEVFDLGWGWFERTTNLDRPGHNTPEEFRLKVKRTLARWKAGKIYNAPTLEEVIAEKGITQNQSQNNDLGAKTGSEGIDKEQTKIVPFRPNILEPHLRKPREWLVPKFLLREHCTMLAAAPGVGKTTLGIEILVSASVGKDFLNIGMPNKPMRCCIINNEETADEIERRIEATVQHFGLNPHEVLENLFIYSGVGAQKFVAAVRDKEGTVHGTSYIEDMREFVQAEKIDILSVDPLVQSHHVNENDNAEMAQVMQTIRDCLLGEEHNAACLVVHHQRKTAPNEKGQRAGDMDTARGASSLGGEAHCFWTLTNCDEGTGERMGLDTEGGEHRFYIRLDDAKEKMGPPENAKWFQRIGEEMVRGLQTEDIGVLAPADMNELTPLIELDARGRILGKIQDAWKEGNPYVRSNNGRNIYKMMADQKVKRAAAETLIQEWKTRGVISSEKYDKGNNKRGLKVVKFEP